MNDSEVFITTEQVCKRYSMSSASLNRWLKDSCLDFPKPIVINARKRLWRLSEITKWEDSKKG
jgi:predicted DNA-binding transcriptional regulator AlpA